MKRRSTLVAAIAALTCCACSTVEEMRMEEFHAGKAGEGIFFELPVPEEDDSEGPSDEGYVTKTYYSSQKGHFAWSETDTIGVVPSSKTSSTGQIFFSVESKSGDTSVNFTGGDWGMKQNTKYSAYYPYADVKSFNKTKVPFSVKGQVQSTNGAHVHDRFDCLYAIATTSKATNGNFYASFDFKRLCSFFKFKIQPVAGTYTKLTLSASSNIIPVEATFDATSTSASLVATTMASSLELKLNNIVIADGEELVAYMTFIPASFSGKKLTVSLFNANGECYSYSMTPAKSYTADKIYTMDIGTKMTKDPASYLLECSAYGLYDLKNSKALVSYEAGKDMYSCTRASLGQDRNFRIMNPNESNYKFISFKFTDSLSKCTIYEPDGAAYNGKSYDVILMKTDENGNRWYKTSDETYGFIVNFFD